MLETNWSVYNKQRKHEFENFVKAAKNVVSTIGPPRPEPAKPGSRGRGRPGYTTGGMLVLNLLRMHLKLSYRDLESFLRENPRLMQNLGFSQVPGRDTIHRHAQTLTEPYLHKFNDALTQRLKKTSYAAPSTPPVSRSKSTRDVGALPRTRGARTTALG